MLYGEDWGCYIEGLKAEEGARSTGGLEAREAGEGASSGAYENQPADTAL